MTRRRTALVLAALTVVSLAVAAGPASATPRPTPAAPPTPAVPTPAVSHGALPRTPELGTSSRLADRRSIVIGKRFYEVGAEDGSYPATGFHTRGEMGGLWSMPIKLLDGIWFGVDGRWLHARRYTDGWGYARMDLGTHAGVRIRRTDVASDGMRAGLIGLSLTARSARTITLTMDAHSELMSAYPWGETKPSQLTVNKQDTGSYTGRWLRFSDPRGYHAIVGSALKPARHALGENYRGPQSADVVCPASSSDAPVPARCDDTAYGKGTGGELRYRIHVPAGGRTVWFAVSGSSAGSAAAVKTEHRALAHPATMLAHKIASRRAIARRTTVHLPGDPRLARSIAWTKQNLADARQQAGPLHLRVTNAGTKYPKPVGTLRTAKWIGAGWPDYPWIFGTDGEYTAFAAVAAGQFTSIEDHLRTLMRISDIVNHRSGKVIHETVPTGDVYFGANSDDGNTDETVKFPSAVALVWRWTGDNAFRDQMYGFTVRNMRYVFAHLDTDHDGWLEGAGNVEREGMGAEKLDNTVYAIRGLLDLADMAASKHDVKTLRWARAKALGLRRRFEQAWWYGRGTASYADSLQGKRNRKLFQRYWIGLTPVEAELPAAGNVPAHPLAGPSRARITVRRHERACFTGRNGLFHTGTGRSSDARGTTRPICDPVVSAAPADREIFTLTTSIAAVAEAALGRSQARRYTGDLARVQLDPKVWEVPGDMPEISPSPKPDFGANIDKSFLERSSGLQAWGAYGVLWPVVHFELGIAPNLGRHRLSVVPDVPTGQHRASASDVRIGRGGIDVVVTRHAHLLTTTVTGHVAARITIGTVLPPGARPGRVTLNGARVGYRIVRTDRGRELLVAGTGARSLALRVTL